MYDCKAMEFSKWVVSELEKRGWSRSEAARRGGISPSLFDKVINGHSKPGTRFIEGIAKAFKISPAEVVMHLHEQKGGDPWIEEMEIKLRRLSPGLRAIAAKFIESMLDGEEAEQRKKHRSPSLVLQRHKGGTGIVARKESHR